MELQDKAVRSTWAARDSIDAFCGLLRAHSFGAAYNLSSVLDKLKQRGLTSQAGNVDMKVDNVFLDRVILCAVNAVLRDIKHRARIPVPNSWNLIGVPDEGPAHIASGDPRYTNDSVDVLKPGEIFGKG